MRVIPAEAAIEIGESESVMIDGTVVTNPLNLGEFVPPSGVERPSLQFVESKPPGTQQALNQETLTGLGGPLTDVLLGSPVSSTFQGTFENTPSEPTAKSEPAPEPKRDATTSLPPNSAGSILTPALTRPHHAPGSGNSNPGSPDNGGGGAIPPSGGGDDTPSGGGGDAPSTDAPDEPEGDNSSPDITLPTDPQGTDPNVPDLEEEKPASPPWEILEPLNPPSQPDHPTHHVPDAGSTLALTALSMAALAALRRWRR
jgi:hypothetical protein